MLRLRLRTKAPPVAVQGEGGGFEFLPGHTVDGAWKRGGGDDGVGVGAGGVVGLWRAGATPRR